MEKIKIIIADDQTLITQSLKIVLETQSKGLSVIGTAHDGKEVLDLIKIDKPDIILMDIRMPELNGVETTRIIHEIHPEIKIIMLTTFDDDELVEQAIKAGANGYLLKDISTDELIAAIKAVVYDIVLVSPAVAAKLFNQKLEKIVEKSWPDWYQQLTDRERDLVSLIKQGYSNKEIAEKLFLAEQTVKNYITVIYSKIGVENRKHARKLLTDLDID